MIGTTPYLSALLGLVEACRPLPIDSPGVTLLLRGGEEESEHRETLRANL